VTVGDSAGPTFSNVPSNITVEASGPSGSRVNFTVPTASDDVDGTSLVTRSPGDGLDIPARDDDGQLHASDSHGNTSSASFTVTVRDTTKPSLLIPDKLFHLRRHADRHLRLEPVPVDLAEVSDGDRPR
jgi:chitinase